MDFEGLLEPVRGVSEPSLEDTVPESFAQLGYDVDFDDPLLLLVFVVI